MSESADLAQVETDQAQTHFAQIRSCVRLHNGFHTGFVPLQAGYLTQPQNCEPGRGPFFAVRNAMGLPQSGQLGACGESV